MQQHTVQAHNLWLCVTCKHSLCGEHCENGRSAHLVDLWGKIKHISRVEWINMEVGMITRTGIEVQV